MIILKSPSEIEIMRDAGRIVAECHAELVERIRPGVATRDLDRMVEAILQKRGATPSFKGYQGTFPAATCIAINDVICHGFPGKERLREGDIVSVDIGAYYKGYHGDQAWSYAVGAVSAEARRLLEATEQCLYVGIDAARPGNRVGDIGHAIQQYAEARGLGVVREFTGHGVGQSLHESPTVLHFGKGGTGTLLRAGMTLAIEPMITLGGWESRTDADGWTARTVDGSLCAQYEHTIALTDHGPEILTKL